MEIKNKLSYFLIDRLMPLAKKYNMKLVDLDKYISQEFLIWWVKIYQDKGYSLGSKFATAPWELALEQKLKIGA